MFLKMNIGTNMKPQKRVFLISIIIFTITAALISILLIIFPGKIPDFTGKSLEEFFIYSNQSNMSFSTEKIWNDEITIGSIISHTREKAESILVTVSLGPAYSKEIITFCAAGDILLQRPILDDANSGETYNFKPIFEDIKPYIETADIAFVNQEVIMGGSETKTTGGTYRGRYGPIFIAPNELADALVYAGFDLISIANNHSNDAGIIGIENTLAVWKKFPSILTNGINEKKKVNIQYKTINGIKISFIAYTHGLNEFLERKERYRVNIWYKSEMKKAITEAQANSDFVIFSLHAGKEFSRSDVEDQRNMVKQLADWGVDLYLGHHPHVLQPVNWIEHESRRKTFVIYSLGNFLSRSTYRTNIEWQEIGGLLYIDLVKERNKNTSKFYLDNPRLLPVKTYYNKSKLTGFKISMLNSEDKIKYIKDLTELMRKYVPDFIVLDDIELK